MKTGRPPVENPKNIKYSIRLDEQTEQELTAYCKRSGITKGEAIRTAIKALLMKATEATHDGVIYLDDLVSEDIEENSRQRLDTLWDKVRGDLLGRRLEGCPIAQGTLMKVSTDCKDPGEIGGDSE